MRLLALVCHSRPGGRWWGGRRAHQPKRQVDAPCGSGTANSNLTAVSVCLSPCFLMHLSWGQPSQRGLNPLHCGPAHPVRTHLVPEMCMVAHCGKAAGCSRRGKQTGQAPTATRSTTGSTHGSTRRAWSSLLSSRPSISLPLVSLSQRWPTRRTSGQQTSLFRLASPSWWAVWRTCKLSRAALPQGRVRLAGPSSTPRPLYTSSIPTSTPRHCPR
jgi:hypothetical protein